LPIAGVYSILPTYYTLRSCERLLRTARALGPHASEWSAADESVIFWYTIAKRAIMWLRKSAITLNLTGTGYRKAHRLLLVPSPCNVTYDMIPSP
jgi:hypothetical protein